MSLTSTAPSVPRTDAAVAVPSAPAGPLGVPTGLAAEPLPEGAWRRMLRHALPVYVLSRLLVIAGAAIVASEMRIDQQVAEEQGLPIGDPHFTAGSASTVRAITNVLTSWDGLWYLRIVRDGYPKLIPPEVTYHVPEARAAFFPLFPMLARAVDTVLPGGDTAAALVLNTVLGLVVVVLAGLLGQRVYGERAGRTAATLIALFPGSFVLSFAYSEALMIALAAACLLMLLDRRWWAAGALAALTTASRPNGVAIVVACGVAALLAIHERREWRSLVAVVLAPVGFVAFQIWLGRHTGEAGAWFRVQREAWDEGASFGWTAIRNTAEALASPLSSPTDTLTAVSLAATILLLVLSWKARLPWTLTVYSWVVVALMLAPATVTARPRFMFTAFPLLIGAAAWYEAHRDRHEQTWVFTIACCGGGLVALTALYGVFGAIP